MLVMCKLAQMRPLSPETGDKYFCFKRGGKTNLSNSIGELAPPTPSPDYKKTYKITSFK